MNRNGSFPQLRGGPPGVPQMPMPASLIGQGYAGDLLADLIQQKIGDRPWNWYQYEADFLPLVASVAAQTSTIQIESDSDFMALACVGIARQTAAPAAVVADRAFNIMMTARGGNNLFSSPTDFDMVVGTAQNPAWWGLPRLMASSTAMNVTLQNLIATNLNVRVGFWGIKIFEPGTSR